MWRSSVAKQWLGLPILALALTYPPRCAMITSVSEKERLVKEITFLFFFLRRLWDFDKAQLLYKELEFHFRQCFS